MSDPSSASYGAYLTPAQAQARFGATSAQIQAVESWLTGAGLTVTGVTGGAGDAGLRRLDRRRVVQPVHPVVLGTLI